MGTEAAALLAAVLEDPDDDLPRLALADWWEGQDEWEGGDQRERAEFVRVQVALAAMPESCRDGKSRMVTASCLTCDRAVVLGRREKELHWSPYLWAPAGPRWHDAPAWGFEWRRGFIRAATCTAPQWLKHGDVLTAAHPIEEVTLTTMPLFAQVGGVPRWGVGFNENVRLALGDRWHRVRHWHLPSRRIEPARTHGAPWQAGYWIVPDEKVR